MGHLLISICAWFLFERECCAGRGSSVEVWEICVEWGEEERKGGGKEKGKIDNVPGITTSSLVILMRVPTLISKAGITARKGGGEKKRKEGGGWKKIWHRSYWAPWGFTINVAHYSCNYVISQNEPKFQQDKKTKRRKKKKGKKEKIKPKPEQTLWLYLRLTLLHTGLVYFHAPTCGEDVQGLEKGKKKEKADIFAPQTTHVQTNHLFCNSWHPGTQSQPWGVEEQMKLEEGKGGGKGKRRRGGGGGRGGDNCDKCRVPVSRPSLLSKSSHYWNLSPHK